MFSYIILYGPLLPPEQGYHSPLILQTASHQLSGGVNHLCLPLLRCCPDKAFAPHHTVVAVLDFLLILKDMHAAVC